MGILDKSSSIHGASGRFGNVIFYTVDGKTYFRQRPQKISDKKSPRQLLQRQRLIAVQTMFKSVRNCILYDVLNCAATLQKRRSGYHLFLKLNTNAFGENDFIDYSQLSFAGGVLQLPYNFRLGSINARQAELVWLNDPEQDSGRGSDQLMVAACFPDEPFRVVILSGVSAVRQDGHAFIPLGEEAAGDIHLYCFFAGQQMKTFSPDRYFCIHQ